MNILVTSVGRRVKLLQYFKEALQNENGNLVAVDCQEEAPALYVSDYFHIVPRITDTNYINTLLAICDRYDIQAIVSLIDPELSLLAKHRELFEKRRITLILSNQQTVEIAFDKYKTQQLFRNNNISFVQTYDHLAEAIQDYELGNIQFPLILKPRFGSAKLDVRIVNSVEELTFHFQSKKDLVIQQYISGNEYGIDIYVDMVTGKTTDIFIKRKIKSRAGETDKSISVVNQDIHNTVAKICDCLPFVGPVDMDCIIGPDGFIYVIDINPRFGGGYLHAYEQGLNYVENIINNLKGIANSPFVNKYESGVVLMKYDTVMLKKVSDDKLSHGYDYSPILTE